MKKERADDQFSRIHKNLSDVITTLTDLLEDPIFLDTIHGEQEVTLDWTLEMLDGLRSKFEPLAVKPDLYPIKEDDSYDAD